MLYSALNFTASTVDADGNNLLGSNTIKDVFYYDTTKDTDGGAWRNNVTAQASSWYNEAFSSTRGRKREFPEKAYIVAGGIGSSSYIDIIDATENKLWMRFNRSSASNMLFEPIDNTEFISSVFALNGNVYYGSRYTTINYGGVGEIKFGSDSALMYGATGFWGGLAYNSDIAHRNSNSNWSAATIPTLIKGAVNDVSVAVISGKTYVAVATDGGVSVVNETDGTVVNITSTGTYKAVNSITVLTSGRLYFTSQDGNSSAVYQRLSVFPSLPSTTQSISGLYNTSTYPGYYWYGVNPGQIPQLANPTSGWDIKSLYITNGTSTVDGTSNTIYVGYNGQLTVLQEKQGDETKGSIKYYDKNHITEEMVGAIKGQWGLWETTATDANQFKASGYLDTGKLGQAVSMYGNAAGTAGSTLTFNRGAQISGNNYEHINTNQGTISFWFKPSWAGNDGVMHDIFHAGTEANATAFNTPLGITKHSNNNLYIQIYDASSSGYEAHVAVTGWTAGTWYHIVARWNSNNDINGTANIDITVNNSTTVGSTSNWVPRTPSSVISIGSSGSKTNQANALIDDFVIFDRVLSTTEITSLYNTGTGNEAGYVADSSLKFYAKMDGSGTLQPVTYNGAASASKATASQGELTGGTNIILNGRMEAATGGTSTSWSQGGGATLADAETASIFADTRSQKISAVNAGDGMTQTMTVTAGTNYHFSGWLKSDGTNPSGFMFYDLTNSAWITAINYTASSSWTNITESFKTPAGCTSIRLYVKSVNTATYAYYVDNITLTPNLVDNGGMEGQYTATGTALYSATVAQTRSGAGPYVYTETEKFATGLAGLIATDGTNFGYITASDANSITVDFTGGSGNIVNNTAFDVKSALAPNMSGSGTVYRNATNHSGNYSQGLTRVTTMPYVTNIGATLTNGNNYLLTFWARTNTNNSVIRVTDGNGGANNGRLDTSFTMPTANTWYKFSIVWKAVGTWNFTLFGNYTNNTSILVDDYSVTLLDNVAMSLKAWAPVGDSSAIGSSLSVHGNATGVQSLAAGVRNSAYTFDGSTGYLRQATIATNIGTLSYVGNDTATASFTDDGATMSTYQTTSGDAAYMIVVTNSDNTVSWGYIGTASSGNITIFTTKARSTRGWNGTAPVAGTKVPVGYEVRRTDFQITGALTVGAWVKLSDTSATRSILGKYGSVPGLRALGIIYANTGIYIFRASNGVAVYDAVSPVGYADTNWHYVVGVYVPSASVTLYIDGIQVNQNTTGIPASLGDVSTEFLIGNTGITSNLFPGSIDEPFVIAEALTASQILDMYNKGLGALNHSTKSDQKLQGTTNTVQAVWGSSDTIIAGTDTALSVIRQGKIGAYTDSDSVVNYFTNATVPALVSANTVAIAVDGTNIVAGSSAAGMTKLYNLTVGSMLKLGNRLINLITRRNGGMNRNL